MLSIAVLLCFSMTSCASSRATVYDWKEDEDNPGKYIKIPIQTLETEGGPVKAVFSNKASIEGEPQLKPPEVPPVQIKYEE